MTRVGAFVGEAKGQSSRVTETQSNSQLLAQVQDDPNLTDEVKDSIIDLIALVQKDPMPDNLRALAIVFEKLSALETIKILKASESGQLQK